MQISLKGENSLIPILELVFVMHRVHKASSPTSL